MFEPAKIELSAGVDGPRPEAPDGGASSAVIVASGTAQLVGGSAAPAVDPEFEAANAACVPTLEEAGIGVAGAGTIALGTLVIGGPDGAVLPAPEGLPK
jgi:hypothetical protein